MTKIPAKPLLSVQKWDIYRKNTLLIFCMSLKHGSKLMRKNKNAKFFSNPISDFSSIVRKGKKRFKKCAIVRFHSIFLGSTLNHRRIILSGFLVHIMCNWAIISLMGFEKKRCSLQPHSLKPHIYSTLFIRHQNKSDKHCLVNQNAGFVRLNS